jgi:hypothetical protein
VGELTGADNDDVQVSRDCYCHGVFVYEVSTRESGIYRTKNRGSGVRDRKGAQVYIYPGKDTDSLGT